MYVVLLWMEIRAELRAAEQNGEKEGETGSSERPMGSDRGDVQFGTTAILSSKLAMRMPR